MEWPGRAFRQTTQLSTVGNRRPHLRAGFSGSAQGAGLLLAAQHFAFAALIEPDDQFEMGAARGDGAGLFRALLRLVDQRIVDFHAPLVALRRLKVVLPGPSECGIP